MKSCEVCDNVYENTFQVFIAGSSHEFDCFECAIHALAPRCYRCGCKVIGHGASDKGVIFCSSHCARTADLGGPYTLSDQPSVLNYL